MNTFKHLTTSTHTSMSSQQTEQMKHLELEGERKVAELIKTNNVTEQTLVNIIDGGNDAFRKMYGRDMTYSEMRNLYG